MPVWWTIRRATIVNVRAIDEVRRQADGRVVVLLRDRAKVLRVSEPHERQFRQM
jgi:DNA-binding LytR/AlgR family response regulator